MNKNSLIIAGVAMVGLVAIAVPAGAIVGDILKKKEEHRHEEAMPNSYWEAKKAEAEASIEIKKLDNEKALEIEKIHSEERIKCEAQRLEAEKDMPEGYFTLKAAEVEKKKAENVARVQAASNEKIEKERLEHELKLEKERNSSNENLAREARWALNALSSIK